MGGSWGQGLGARGNCRNRLDQDIGLARHPLTGVPEVSPLIKRALNNFSVSTYTFIKIRSFSILSYL